MRLPDVDPLALSTLDIDASYPVVGKSYIELLTDAEQLLKIHKIEAALLRIIAAGRLLGNA